MDIVIRYVSFAELKPLFCLRKESVDFKLNNKTSYLGAFINDKIVGCVGWQKVGDVLRYKCGGVLPNYRNRGIYSYLYAARDKECAKIPRIKTTAFCTEMSLNKLLSNGFFKIKQRNGITFVEK